MPIRLSYGGVITVVGGVTLIGSNRKCKLLEMAVTRRKQTAEFVSNRNELDPRRGCVPAGSHDDSGPMEAL